MIQPMSMNAAVPTPMGTHERAADAVTLLRPVTEIAAMRQATASQNGGEAMIWVTSDGKAECSARARAARG